MLMRYLMLLTLILSLPACVNQPTVKMNTRIFPQLDIGGHQDTIKDIVFTPDGRYLLSAGNDKVARAWNLSTGRTERTQRGQIGLGHDGKNYAMAMSPDGRLMAIGGFPSRWGIRVYDFASGQIVALLLGHTNVVLSLAFSPDSRLLVSGDFDNNAILWDVEGQQRLHTLSGHTNHIYAVAFTPDNQRVVTGSLDHTLRLWQVEDGKLIATLEGHLDQVRTVAIFPQDGTIVSGSYDNTIRLWDGKTGLFIETLAELSNPVAHLAVSPDGQYLISAMKTDSQSLCHVLSIPDGNKMVTYQGHDKTISATAVSPDGHWVATAGGNKNEIDIWSLHDGKRQQRLMGTDLPNTEWAVGFSSDGLTLAWGNTWKQSSPTNRGPLKYRLNLPTSDRPLGTPERLEDDSDFIRAQDKWQDWTLNTQMGEWGKDSILNLLDGNRLFANVERVGTNGYRHWSYTFTPDGNTIISGGSNGVLTAYNFKGKKVGEYVGHTGEIWGVAVSPDGRLLASVSADKSVRLWNVKTE